jgi:hypothetical protein
MVVTRDLGYKAGPMSLVLVTGPVTHPVLLEIVDRNCREKSKFEKIAVSRHFYLYP